MSLLDIVHDVQFTYILKVFIHCFDQIMNELQIGHFVLSYLKCTSYYKSSPTMKYKLAYLRYITLQPRYSIKEQRVSLRERHFRTSSPSSVVLSFTVIWLQYLAKRVWPCLFTISRNLIIVCLFIILTPTKNKISDSLKSVRKILNKNKKIYASIIC